MNKIIVNIENDKHSRKPNFDSIRKIQNSIYKQEVQLTVEQFAYEISKNGKTSMLATFNRTEDFKERTNNINFKQQQIVMLDFDNSEDDVAKFGVTKLEDIKNDSFIQENASFIYRTFSDLYSEYDKFRVVIVLDESVVDYIDIQNIYEKLLKKYPSADKKCKNTNRLFFGGKSGYETIDFNNRLNVQEFLSDIVKVKNDLSKFNVTTTKIKQYNIKKFEQNEAVYALIKQNTVESLSKAREITLQKYSSEISKVFNSKAQARVNFRHTLDIKQFLDLPAENPFCDVLTDEENPSASVFEKNGVQLYHLFNKEVSNNFDIIRLIARMIENNAKQEDVYNESLDILLFLTDSKIDKTSKIANIVDDIQLVKNILLSETLKYEYNNLYKILGNDILALTVILDLMSEYSYEDFKTGEIRQLLFMNSVNLARIINHRLQSNYTKDRVQRVLTKATLIQFVDKLNDSEIPSELLEKYTSEQIAKKHMTINFYELSNTTIEQKENISAQLVFNNFTLKSLNFEGISRILGVDVAKKVFNNREEYASKARIQVNSDGFSEIKQEQESQVALYILNKLKSRDYVTEKEVEIYTKKYILKCSKSAERLIKQVRVNICNNYNLKLEKVNKNTRTLYNINNKVNSNSTVYVKIS